jgi:hypothetical protein
MARILGADIMDLLRPNGGWLMIGDDWEGIEFVNCEPVTKAEFEQALADYPKLLADKVNKTAADKAALLTRLGITADEAKLLLS